MELVSRGQPQCDILDARLRPGQRAKNATRSEINIRNRADLSGGKLGTLAAGVVVDVLEGPVRSDGYHWFKIRHGSVIGWAAESGNCNYWLQQTGDRVSDPVATPTSVANIRKPGEPITVGGDCTMDDAIQAANDDRTTGGCVGGRSGTDTIRLNRDFTLRWGEPLPDITSAITIDANGHEISGKRVPIFYIRIGGNLTIRNATLSNGYSDPVYSDGIGGAISNSGKLTISNSEFTGNSAGVRGGVIYNRPSGSLTINDSKFADNSAGGRGGAIYNRGEASISNSKFASNSAGRRGGAIYNLGELTIRDSEFTHNSVGDAGGAIDHGGRSIELIGNSFSNNSPDNCSGVVCGDAPPPTSTASPEPTSTTGPTSTPEPTATTPPTATPTPAAKSYTSSIALMADHGILITTPHSFEVVYPALDEDLDDGRLRDLRVLESASIHFRLNNIREEVCFPDGAGLFFLRYWDTIDSEWKLAPLHRYSSGGMNCVETTVQTFATIIRVEETDAARAKWRSLAGDQQSALRGRIRKAMPNPIVYGIWSAVCSVQELYNQFLTSPIGEFSYAFSKVLYDDTKAIYGTVKPFVDEYTNKLVDFIVEETQAVYEMALGIVDSAVLYVANKMVEQGIELPTDEQMEAWVNEFIDSVWEARHVLDRIGAVVKLAEAAPRFANAVIQQAQHLPGGLSKAQKAAKLIQAGGKTVWRGVIGKKDIAVAKNIFHTVVKGKTDGVASIKAKAKVAPKLAAKLLAKVKLVAVHALHTPAAAAAKVVAAGAIWAVIARGTTGAIYDIIDGKHDAFFQQREDEARRARQNCFGALSSIGNVSEENLRIIRNSLDELLDSYGIG